MWPARRLAAIISLRAFVGPFQALEAQLPACSSAAAALNHGAQNQWQQTRGMAVPKRKVQYQPNLVLQMAVLLPPVASDRCCHSADLPQQKRAQKRDEVPQIRHVNSEVQVSRTHLQGICFMLIQVLIR